MGLMVKRCAGQWVTLQIGSDTVKIQVAKLIQGEVSLFIDAPQKVRILWGLPPANPVPEPPPQNYGR